HIPPTYTEFSVPAPPPVFPFDDSAESSLYPKDSSAETIHLFSRRRTGTVRSSLPFLQCIRGFPAPVARSLPLRRRSCFPADGSAPLFPSSVRCLCLFPQSAEGSPVPVPGFHVRFVSGFHR